MGLFGSPPPAPTDEQSVSDPAQAFVPFSPTPPPAPAVDNAVDPIGHLLEDTIVTQTQQIETIQPAAIAPTPEPAAEKPQEEHDSASLSGSDAPFPKQVTDQVEAMLQQSIEDEQQAIEQEHSVLKAKHEIIQQQKAQLETLRQSIGSQESAINDQEAELAHRTEQLESREGRVAKVMQTLES